MHVRMSQLRVNTVMLLLPIPFFLVARLKHMKKDLNMKTGKQSAKFFNEKI